MINNYKAKIIYIVDYCTFDAVVNPGFYLTTRIRCTVKDMTVVPYSKYGQVKRILSELILNKTIIIKTTKGDHYSIWLVDMYEQIENSAAGDLLYKDLNKLFKHKVAELLKDVEKPEIIMNLPKEMVEIEVTTEVNGNVLEDAVQETSVSK